MKDFRYRNVVNVRENGQISDFQLIMLSFRPISFYEIDDNYEELCQEIIDQVDNVTQRSSMLQFISAFKSTIDSQSVEPMRNYLKALNTGRLSLEQQDGICKSIQSFLEYNANQTHLYN